MGDRFKKFRIDLASRHSIEPDEIFFDNAKLKEFEESEINTSKLERPITRTIFFGIYALQLCVLVFFLSYSGFLAIKKGSYYTAQAQDNSSRAIPIYAQRGDIYSSDGELLAQDKLYFDIYIKPFKISPPARLDEAPSKRAGDLSKGDGSLDSLNDRDAIISEKDLSILSGNIASVIDLSEAEIYEKFNTAHEKKFSEFVFLRGISRDILADLEQFVTDVPFIEIWETSRRDFKRDISLSHIIGYTGEANQTDILLNKNIRGERVGRIGIEAFYDEELRGKTGLLIKKVNSDGEVLASEFSREPSKGSTINLHLNSRLQEEIYAILTKHVDALDLPAAVAIVLDPATGGVIAMVNAPSFDANLFEHGISGEEFDKLIASPQKILFNRAIAGEYPSGSVIKPIIAGAALEENIVSAGSLIYAGGTISVPSVYNPEVIYDFRDWKVHGWTDARKAIADSVNIYFYAIGGGFKEQEGLGIQKIAEYLKKFGWGNSLGIDLTGEGSGLIPDPKWKKEVKGENWYIGDTYHVSIGQGDILATPLQVAAATVVFANGGTLFSPKIVSGIDGNELPPTIIRENLISDKNIQIVREGMRKAVETGSSHLLAALSIRAAGKTGTAQTGRERNHAWFTGFAPYENPEIVVTVLLEEGDKSNNAVAVAKEIFEAYIAINAHEGAR